jgi:phosphoadenosine phosphosulfate reductase
MTLSRPEEVILEAVDRFGEERLALAASWQKETAVLVDMVQRHAPGARIFTLDTGVLFEETYATWRAVEERYGISVEAWRGEWVHGLWATEPDRCCFLRKIEPLQRALEDADCWISGVRRDQSAARAETEELGWDDRHGLWKANPLAVWSERDVWAYIARHDLPYNPLHDQGYSSIGCTHCTLPGNGRDGRWAGRSKSECGMHVPVAGRAAA